MNKTRGARWATERFATLALLLLLTFGFTARAASLRGFAHNYQGLEQFKSKAYYPAYQEFLRALEHDPLNPMIHLNLARTFEANEEYEKAEQAYKAALKLLSANSRTRFETIFNLAGVQAKQSRIADALNSYQQALELEPDSLEVKTNIELLWQQGGQGGKGNQQQQQQNQDQNQQGRNQQPPQNQDNPKSEPQQKKQPKPFESQELTPQDVKRILDEIKNQEQNIRAQEYEKGAKEAPRGKDW